ncbi:MAG: hypothetical protein JWN50_310 [Parcubacteria group bacterium]|nr:hypothetical protein [Parcubacteria group bacterium]
MSLNKKLLFLLGAVILLAVSIKFFPYHCNCNVKQSLTGSATTTATTTLDISTRTEAVSMGAPQVKIDDAIINVDISDTPALREQGLSGRNALAKDSGMLFVFQTPTQPGFWMKDMNFSLDIVWISSEKKIIGVEKSLSPDTYPKTFYPPGDILYVLELPAGYFDAHRFKIGDSVSIL